MADPISGPIDFWFLAFGLAFFLWVALDTRRALRIVFFLSKPESERVILSLRILAAIVAFGTFLTVIVHIVLSLSRAR
jgi:hypothetical protein